MTSDVEEASKFKIDLEKISRIKRILADGLSIRRSTRPEPGRICVRAVLPIYIPRLGVARCFD